MSRRVYVAHSKVIVFGEELAKSGVRDCIDFFARAPEARMTVHVFVAKGKAADILDIETEFEKMPSVQLLKILKDQSITSHAPIITEFDLVNRMVSKTTAGIAPIVSAIEDEGKKRMDVSGCAVFKESRMVGELDINETRGMMYVLNKVKTGVLELSIRDSTATVEIRRARSKVKPVLYTDGSSKFNVEVEATVGIGDQSGTFNIADPDNIREMVGAAAAEIEKEIMSAVSKSKELRADVFGFGEHLGRKYPTQWKELSKDWDALYPQIGVDVTVKVKSDGSGRIGKPLAPLEGA
jgi:spore germination protein KC